MRSRCFQVTGMHCASCGLLVDDTLEDILGVTRAETDVRAGTSRVDSEPEIDDAVLIAAIEALGYRATRAG